MAEKSTYADLDARLERLIRQPHEDISAYLSTVELNAQVANTKALAHFHMLAFDGNDRPRTAELAAYLGNIIIDYAMAICPGLLKPKLRGFSRLGASNF